MALESIGFIPIPNVYQDANLALKKIEDSRMFDNECVSIVDNAKLQPGQCFHEWKKSLVGIFQSDTGTTKK